MPRPPISRFTVLKPTIDNENGLLGWWRFDDLRGSDFSGSGLQGALVGSPTFAPAEPGTAIVCASGKYCDVANLPALTSWSVTAWVFSTASISAEQDIFCCSGTNFIFYAASGTLGAWNGAGVLNAPTAVSAGIWYHAGFTSDGTTRRLYLNGIQDTSGSAGASGFAAGTGTIGALHGSGRPWLGRLADVRLYSRALAAQEINAIYNRGRSGFALTPDEWESPVIKTAASFIPAWARQSNLPVLGAGIY